MSRGLGAGSANDEMLSQFMISPQNQPALSYWIRRR